MLKIFLQINAIDYIAYCTTQTKKSHEKADVVKRKGKKNVN